MPCSLTFGYKKQYREINKKIRNRLDLSSIVVVSKVTLTLKSEDVLQQRILKVLEAEDLVHVVVVFQRLVEVIILQSGDVRVKSVEEIRQIVDLREAEFQLDKHLFDMVYVIPRLLPFLAHFEHQSFLLLSTKRFLMLFIEDYDEFEEIVLLSARLEESLQRIVQHRLVPSRSKGNPILNQSVVEDLA